MFVMACTTSPAFLLMNMGIVEIFRSVAESGGVGLGVLDHYAVVALEAEVVTGFGKGRIEGGWEVVFEQARIVRTVRVVARGAGTLAGGAVNISTLCYLSFHIGQDRAIGQLVSAVMAIQAEVSRGSLDEMPSLRKVGRMTTGAASGFEERLVRNLRI